MKKAIQKGFTLIELMIVVAIVGILAAIALPAYQDYTVRTKISEGLVLSEAIKQDLSVAWAADSIAGVNNYITGMPLVSSKYVDSIVVATGTGVITITYNVANVGSITAAANQLSITPFVNPGGGPGVTPVLLAAAAAGGITGTIDFACASVTNATATGRGFAGVVPPANPLIAKYAPTECK